MSSLALFIRFIPAVAVLLLAGCSTVESRIKEKPAAFAALDPAAQEKLRKGVVEIGNTSDLVYIALGKPDDKIFKITKNGEDETWIYNNYYQDFAGTALVGYRRYVVIDPQTRRAIVYVEPVYTDLYRERTEERLRIAMKSGRVESIEEVKS